MKLFYTILLLVSLKVGATNYYWSSSAGSDANGSNTSSSTPWQTSGKFSTFMTAGTANTGDSILFKRGDTFSGFIVTTCNSGINIGAYGMGALPVINGFTALTSWTETFTGSHLWQASVNSGSNLDEVLVNGKVTPAGRTPNTGSYYHMDSYTALSSGSGTITSTSITSNWTGGQVVHAPNAFNRDRCLITGTSGTTITYSSPDNPKSISDNNRFFIQKHLATLDVQNEWYYNAATNVITMYSMSNPSGLNVQAATQQYFFKVDYRHDISFSNLHFQGLDSFVISSRFPIRFNIINNEFADIGTDAIYFDTDSSCKIWGNKINRCGNSGVDARFSAHAWIDNNIVDSCGMVLGMNLSNNQQAVGIMIESYPGDLRAPGDSTIIANNIVSHTGYAGIRFLGDHAIVEHNRVDSFGMIMSDAGGIYTNGQAHSTDQGKVRYNIVNYGLGNNDMMSNTTNGGMPALYFDDNTQVVEVYGNYFSGGSRFGIFLHNSEKIHIHDNILYNNRDDGAIGAIHDNLGISIVGLNIHDNIINTPAAVPQITLYSQDSDEGSMGVFVNNKYSRSTAGNLFNVHSSDISQATWASTYSDKTSSFQTIPDDSVRAVYNSGKVASTVTLANSYIDYSNRGYYQNVVIQPFQSILMIKKYLPSSTFPGKRKFVTTTY
jgi:hypothetical protein